MADGEQTKVLGGNPQIAKELDIQPASGWEDALCDQYLSNNYRLIKKLGQGGMGSVYMAEQVSLRRTVALKMLNPMLARNRAFLDRFISEAKAAAQVNHRNLVQIYDVGESNGVYFFSMEMVDGENVGQILDRRRVIPHNIALEIIVPIVSALSAAHVASIIHRDVKPDNILVSTDGSSKLADLGIAKIEGVAAMPDHRRTESGAQLGTPHYISPEQARNPTDVDARADIYSLGATLFHMVTGRPPYEGNNPAVILRKLATEPVPVASELNSLVPYPLSNVISRMMAKLPHERYSGPEELYQVLVELRNQFHSTKKTTSSTQRIMVSEQMRIEAPAEEAPLPELRLEGEEEEKEADLYGSYAPRVSRPDRPAGPNAGMSTAIEDPDTYVPSVRRPPGPRPPGVSLSGAPGGSVPRPPRPGGRPPRPSAQPAQPEPQQNVGLIIGASVGAVALLIGLVIILGDSDTPDPTPTTGLTSGVDGRTSGTSSSSSSSRSSGTPTLTRAERREQSAQAMLGKYATVTIKTLRDAELAKMIETCLEVVETYPDTQAAANARIRLSIAQRTVEDRQYRQLYLAIEDTRSKGQYAKAEAVGQDFIARHGKDHGRYQQVKGEIERVEKEADEAYAKLQAALDELLEQRDHPAGRELLLEARPLQTKAIQARIDKALQRVADAALVYDRMLELRDYPLYWRGVLAKLVSEEDDGGLAGALAQAKASYKASAGLHEREAELADLERATKGLQHVASSLEQAEGKEITLEYVKRGRTHTASGQLKKDGFQPEKGVILMASKLLKFNELGAKSLVELGGDGMKGPEGQLALALILRSFGRTEEARAALGRGATAEAEVYRRHLLRFTSPELLAVKAKVDAEPGGKPSYEALADAMVLVEGLKGTPYEKGAQLLADDWSQRHVGSCRAAELMRVALWYAEGQARRGFAKSTPRACGLSRAILRWYHAPGDRGPRTQAQSLIDQLCGK